MGKEKPWAAPRGAQVWPRLLYEGSIKDFLANYGQIGLGQRLLEWSTLIWERGGRVPGCRGSAASPSALCSASQKLEISQVWVSKEYSCNYQRKLKDIFGSQPFNHFAFPVR